MKTLNTQGTQQTQLTQGTDITQETLQTQQTQLTKVPPVIAREARQSQQTPQTQGTGSLRVVAAIPCLNTAPFIADIVAMASKYVDQVIVIDDGSHDGTAEAASKAGALVISQGINLGKGAAMKTAVCNTDADIIVFLDGDGAHDPQDIHNIISPILTGKADLVIGSRVLPGAHVPVSPLGRKLSNNIASLTISLIVSLFLPLVTLFKCPMKRIRIADCTSGFRAIRRDSWEKLNLTSQGFQIETEMIYEAARNKLIIIEVPISCQWSSKLSHLSILRDGLRTLKLLARKLITEISGR